MTAPPPTEPRPAWIKDTCAACRFTTNAQLVRSIQANGKSRAWYRCSECGQDATNKSIPHTGIPIDQLPIIGDNTHTRPPCARCGAWGTEEHHFFPVEIAGREEADLWPKAWLCPDCHHRWHVAVIVRRSERRAS